MDTDVASALYAKAKIVPSCTVHFDAHLLSLSVCAGPDFSHKEMMGDVCLKHVKRPLCA